MSVPSSQPARGKPPQPRRVKLPPVHGVLVVDKPNGPTSHDVVSRARRILGTRAVGHAGTLDPMASGVLVLGIGEGTKLLQHLTGADKTYLATIQLGAQTDSLDAQGQVIETADVPDGLTLEHVAQVALGFLGELTQRVPEISAVRIDGERLYARARRGETVVAPERQVFVHTLEILRVEAAQIDLRVHCAKGFYVRSLARDLARALGSVGHLTQLRRTHSGAFSIDDAVTAASLEGERDALLDRLITLPAALRDCARCTLTEAGVIEVRHGRVVRPEHCVETSVSWDGLCGQQPIALLDEQGALRALGRGEEDRVLVIRGMAQS